MSISKSVCICIPCYNNGKTIFDTLKSILDQSYKNIIIKVFDNASTDNTLSIVGGFIKRGYPIEIYSNEITSTGEENFNRCIQHAEGHYTAIFHSDDVYENTIIEDQVAFLERTSCLAVATHATIIDSDGRKIGERFLPSEIKNLDSVCFNFEEIIPLIFRYGNFITCPSVLFSTAVLKNEIIAFRSDKFKTSSDLDVWLRISKLGQFGFINKKLINYRASEASYSFNLSKFRAYDHDMFLVLRYYLDEFSGVKRKKLEGKYKFLLYKDRVKTNINRILRSDKELKSIDLFETLKNMSFTGFHFKYLFVVVIYKVLITFPFRASLFKLIKKIGFIS